MSDDYYRPVSFNLHSFGTNLDPTGSTIPDALARFRDLGSVWANASDPRALLDCLELSIKQGFVYRGLDRPLRRFAIWCATEVANARNSHREYTRRGWTS